MILKIRFTLVILLISLTVCAQNRFLRRGEKAFAKGYYPEAIANLKNIKEKNSDVNRKIAESYFYLGKYQQAENYYKKVDDEKKSVDDFLALSHIHLNSGNFETAVLFCERAVQAGADRERADKRIKAIQDVASRKNQQLNLHINPLSIQPKSKSLGLTSHSNQILFSDLNFKNAGGAKSHQLFASELKDGRFMPAKNFAPKLDAVVDIGAICFSADGNIMYYTRWYTKKGRQMMEIVQAEQKKEKWRATVLLPFNSRKYSCCYPFISKDGKTLYFASDMPGGKGGMDLYMCQKRGKNWGAPVNLGSSLNTNLNEIYPKLLNDGKLWFASDGHVGYGKLDLFYASKMPSGKWGNVKNAGSGYNTSFNDFSITGSPLPEQVLFVSDRVRAKGLIYSLGIDKKVAVQVLVKDFDSKEFLENSTVKVNRVLDNQNLAVNLNSDFNAHQFEISQYDLGEGILYEIVANKLGYKSGSLKYYPTKTNLIVELFLKELANSTMTEFADKLYPIHYPDKRVLFRNVYFDSGSDFLNDDTQKTLNKCADLLKLYPGLGLVINAHTDSKGSNISNETLSLKRAQMARDYLVAKGISSKKINMNAYGEKFIINGCVDGVECSEEEHRENRRLELLFVVK